MIYTDVWYNKYDWDERNRGWVYNQYIICDERRRIYSSNLLYNRDKTLNAGEDYEKFRRKVKAERRRLRLILRAIRWYIT